MLQWYFFIQRIGQGNLPHFKLNWLLSSLFWVREVNQSELCNWDTSIFKVWCDRVSMDRIGSPDSNTSVLAKRQIEVLWIDRRTRILWKAICTFCFTGLMRPKIWNFELFGMITLRHLYFGGAYFAGLVTFMRNLKDIFYG